MLNSSLAALAAAFAVSFIAAFPADDDCRLEIRQSPNGTIKFACPKVACNAGLCQTDDSWVFTPPGGVATTMYTCYCTGNGGYAPLPNCEGIGYIDGAGVWDFECIQWGCATPCDEFTPPMLAWERVCDC